VCCISLNFPPSTIASVHRARHLAKHLPSHGWQPTIVCVDERDINEDPDWKLWDLVPTGTVIRKIRSVPLNLTRPLGLTDLGLRAYWTLRREIEVLLQSNHYDVIFITGWPFYQMLLGNYFKRRFGVPIVLDFQDPWVSPWGAAQPALSKAGLSHLLATLLEPRALRAADFVTSVSDIQNAEMAARYPWLDGQRMHAVPIGCDREDFEAMRSTPAEADQCDLGLGLVNLGYVGTYLPRSKAPMHALFRAFARLRAREPVLAARLRFNFIGTSNQSNDRNTLSVKPIAESEGVADAVREIPQRLPYLRALKWVVESDGLLLIGSDEPHYTASKIYPALMSGRPYLSLFHRASSAHAILSAAGGGCTWAFETQKELDELEEPLAEGLKTLALRPDAFGAADPAMYAAYEASAIAGRFADIFDRVVSTRSR
jgi:Glycosyl transferase 4-like domain